MITTNKKLFYACFLSQVQHEIPRQKQLNSCYFHIFSKFQLLDLLPLSALVISQFDFVPFEGLWGRFQLFFRDLVFAAMII